jgi:hypothetical protein
MRAPGPQEKLIVAGLVLAIGTCLVTSYATKSAQAQGTGAIGPPLHHPVTVDRTNRLQVPPPAGAPGGAPGGSIAPSSGTPTGRG